MAVVPEAGEALSPQAADLIRRVARVVLDEPADLMAEVHAAVLAAASRRRRGAGSGLACGAGLPPRAVSPAPHRRVPAQPVDHPQHDRQHYAQDTWAAFSPRSVSSALLRLR